MARQDPNDTNPRPVVVTGSPVADKLIAEMHAAIMRLDVRLKAATEQISQLIRADGARQQEIAKLEKALKRTSFDPVRHYGKNEIDYSDWPDEEECMTETARTPKPDKYNNW